MILHVDMDAFYASVEERDRPELAGRPVIVGGDPNGRSVVSAANYEARKYGVHSALASAIAVRRCPHAAFIKPRFDEYARTSRQIRAIFHRFTPLVEPLALDEAFLDVNGSVRLFGPPAEIARQIKTAIRSELRLVASVGVAPNKFLAKIASDLKKPDGFCVVEEDHVQAFLDPLPIGRLWGLGQASHRWFDTLGITTIGQLRKLDPRLLREQFGRQGEKLWRLARGEDDRAVVPDQMAKSISHETTFPVDITDAEVLRAWLLELTEQVARRLRAAGLRGRTVHLKIRFADFRTLTRSHTLADPTLETQRLWTAVRDIFSNRLPVPLPPVRLVGVGTSGLEQDGPTQGNLFFEAERQKQARLDAAADRIQAKFGDAALERAAVMAHDAKHKPAPKPDE